MASDSSSQLFTTSQRVTSSIDLLRFLDCISLELSYDYPLDCQITRGEATFLLRKTRWGEPREVSPSARQLSWWYLGDGKGPGDFTGIHPELSDLTLRNSGYRYTGDIISGWWFQWFIFNHRNWMATLNDEDAETTNQSWDKNWGETRKPKVKRPKAIADAPRFLATAVVGLGLLNILTWNLCYM